ncbi:hemerythrin domain-containing protein [Candidatus Pacearchaeota archaeon]|nr:hemerythrin domain-containing protein [Candidatus Pacearchaeota archaeon]
MKTAVQILSGEHENILKIAEALNKECDALESGKKLNTDFFSKAIEFIRGYADRFHHAKEEDILFKELCRLDAKMHCNPVEQMLYEHNLGRNFVKGMEEGLKEGNNGRIIENARRYSQLIQEHINKEDNILYPMAEEALSEKAKESILKKFKEIEKKKKKDKEKALAFIKSLK